MQINLETILILANFVSLIGVFMRNENRMTKVETTLDLITRGLINANIVERRGE